VCKIHFVQVHLVSLGGQNSVQAGWWLYSSPLHQHLLHWLQAILPLMRAVAVQSRDCSRVAGADGWLNGCIAKAESQAAGADRFRSRTSENGVGQRCWGQSHNLAQSSPYLSRVRVFPGSLEPSRKTEPEKGVSFPWVTWTTRPAYFII